MTAPFDAALPLICTICEASEDSTSASRMQWVSKDPAICAPCIVRAVEQIDVPPGMSIRVVAHPGGVDSVRCDGDGNVDGARAHSPACNGYLYPDEQYIEARYALGGRIDDPHSVVVTMRHSLACFAAFHAAAAGSLDAPETDGKPS